MARSVWLAIALILLQAVPIKAALAFTFFGRVTGPSGQPLDDVDLDVDDLATGERLQIEDDDTNADGRFSFDLPAGIYTITFEPPPGTRVSAKELPRVEIVSDLEVNVQLEAGVALAGRVTDADGRGVADVDLDAWDLARGTQIPISGDDTNTFGFYTVVVPPGVYRLEFEPPPVTRLAAARLDTVDLMADRVIPVQLEAGVELSGVVRGVDGGPVSDVDLDLTVLETGRDLPIAGDKTGPDGRFTVIVPVGTYDLLLDAPVATRMVSQVVEGVEITGDTSLDLSLSTGFVLNGTVFDAGGVPIEGVNMDFLLHPERTAVTTPADFTDALGRYAVVLPGGVYDVIAIPPLGYDVEPDTTLGIEVQADQVLDLRFGDDPVPGPIEPPTSPPAALVLLPVFPNPAKAGATIPFRVVPDGGPISVRIYDAQGRLIRNLFDGAVAETENQLFWDGRNQQSSPVRSGVYFVRIEQGDERSGGKLMLLRGGS